jgi:hypothetical protein
MANDASAGESLGISMRRGRRGEEMGERPKDGEHRAGVPEPVPTPPIVAGDADGEGLEGIDAADLWPEEVDGDDGG